MRELKIVEILNLRTFLNLCCSDAQLLDLRARYCKAGLEDVYNVVQQVDDFVEAQLWSASAPSTKDQYQRKWEVWEWWAKARDLGSPCLRADTPEEARAAEAELLLFAGYLGWLGTGHATVHTHIFAIKAWHLIAGAKDPTRYSKRIWKFVVGLKRSKVGKPRKLGSRRPCSGGSERS